jgi:hypothetical protein
MRKIPLDFTDRIRVVANVHDLDVDRYLIEVEFRHIDGRTATATLPRGIIKSGSEALKELLDRGAKLPTGPGAGAQLADLLNVTPDRTYLGQTPTRSSMRAENPAKRLSRPLWEACRVGSTD